MKKKLLSLSLCLCLALSMVVTAYATDTKPIISDEQYQNYLEIAEQVGEERGIDITVYPESEMDKAYTDTEFEAEMQEFCDVIDSIKSGSSITPLSNPSPGGVGMKSLEVSAPKNLAAGYYLWRLNCSVRIGSGNGYYKFDAGTASIDYITLLRFPSGYSSTTNNDSKSVLNSSNQQILRRSVNIFRNGTAVATVTFEATFVLNTETGVVTLRGKAL